MGPGLVILLAGLGLTARIEGAPGTGADPGGARSGREIYDSMCVLCHGEKGDGLGPAASVLSPRPRDFVRGTFRIRSTPSGSLPTDQDLIRTVRAGISGTSMPAWNGELSDDEIASVVEVVKSFSSRFEEEGAGEPIDIPPAPPMTAAMVAAGKEVYEKMQCAQCHGPEGRGDGPAAASLRDDSGLPIKPYDYTKAGRMKGGAAPEDIYRAFSTGLDGTPMPQYGDFLTPEQRWQLVAFVQARSDQDPDAHRPAHDRALRDSSASDSPCPDNPIRAVERSEIATDPLDPSWDSLPVTPVPVRSVHESRPASGCVEVRAAWNGSGIGFLLEWSDRVRGARIAALEDLADAVAIQLLPGVVAGVPSTAAPPGGVRPGLAPIVWRWGGDPGRSDPEPGSGERAAGVYLDGRWRVLLRGIPVGPGWIGSSLQDPEPLPVSLVVRDISRDDPQGTTLVSRWVAVTLAADADDGSVRQTR